VATLLLAPGIGTDLQRIRDHLVTHEATDVDVRVQEIIEALRILTRHPLIGRPSGLRQRELVIGRGTRGYVARYAYDMGDDLVVVTALRAQREAGFRV